MGAAAEMYAIQKLFNLGRKSTVNTKVIIIIIIYILFPGLNKTLFSCTNSFEKRAPSEINFRRLIFNKFHNSCKRILNTNQERNYFKSYFVQAS